MTRYEVSLLNIISGLDLLISKTQVADSDTAGLLGVILEICLCVFIGIITDDLDAVLVRTYCTVGAQTPEFAGDLVFRFTVRHLARFEGKTCHVVVDGDGEFFLRFIRPEVFVNRQQIAAAAYPWNPDRNVRLLPERR